MTTHKYVPYIESSRSRLPVPSLNGGRPLDIGQRVTLVAYEAPQPRQTLYAGVVLRHEAERVLVTVPALDEPGAVIVIALRALRRITENPEQRVHGWFTYDGVDGHPTSLTLDEGAYRKDIKGSPPGERRGAARATRLAKVLAAQWEKYNEANETEAYNPEACQQLSDAPLYPEQMTSATSVE